MFLVETVVCSLSWRLSGLSFIEFIMIMDSTLGRWRMVIKCQKCRAENRCPKAVCCVLSC